MENCGTVVTEGVYPLYISPNKGRNHNAIYREILRSVISYVSRLSQLYWSCSGTPGVGPREWDPGSGIQQIIRFLACLCSSRRVGIRERNRITTPNISTAKYSRKIGLFSMSAIYVHFFWEAKKRRETSLRKGRTTVFSEPCWGVNKLSNIIPAAHLDKSDNPG